MVTNNIGPIRLSSVEHKVHKQGIKLFDFQILNFEFLCGDYRCYFEFCLRFKVKCVLLTIIYDTHL
jgi:hypothetical protein